MAADELRLARRQEAAALIERINRQARAVDFLGRRHRSLGRALAVSTGLNVVFIVIICWLVVR